MQMPVARPVSKPTFLWQVLLILLPIVALSAIGWRSLREDKLQVQREAADRAQVIADELLPKIWDELRHSTTTNRFKQYYFQIDGTGRLTFPPAPAPLPLPAVFDFEKLEPLQKQ